MSRTLHGARESNLRAAIAAFSPDTARAWCEGLGQATFVGSSGRVFPAAMKASPLLRAWLGAASSRRALNSELRHRFVGFDSAMVSFCSLSPQGRVAVKHDAVVLALGGASWPRLGSDGGWTQAFWKDPAWPSRRFQAGELRISHRLRGPTYFVRVPEGQPLKRIALSFGG